ncbi:putative mannosyltransferase YycA [Ktedonobacteria bacterium brp13]|nr:putative mannosyltransferase YycA [Ktedonobacteria bacterium brp13]
MENEQAITGTPTTRPQTEPEHPIEPREPEPQRLPIIGQRLALFGILLLAACMDFYRLGQDGFGSYYPPAVRSMMDNWHNFFFAAYDPGGITSLDKPPVGFWFQVLSAKIFGFNTVSVLLPQALAGVLSVLLLYFLVRRHFGVVAGLLAALVLAISPISVATNRNATIDSTLTLCLLLGAWAVMRAAESGRLRWLLLSALIVGIGFNIKMMEAYLVVPTFGLLYLLAAPTSMKKRVLHLALALLVLLIVSFSWAAAVDLTPASQRPYVASTLDDSEINLALGYDGIERLTQGKPCLQACNSSATRGNPGGGQGGPPSSLVTSPRGTITVSPNSGPGSNNSFSGGTPGPLRLFTEPLAEQSGWLLPLALLGLVALAWQGRPRPREDRRVQSLLLWGMWLLSTGIFFSAAPFIHEYYLTIMAPALAALCGIGLVMMWRDYRAGGWRGWLLPAALLLTAVEQIVILTTYPEWGLWMIPLLTIPCLLAAGMLISTRLASRLTDQRKATRVLLPALAVGLVALALAPTVWAAIPIFQGNESDLPMAGPVQEGQVQQSQTCSHSGNGTGGQCTHSVDGPFDPAQIHYLEEHQGHARVLVVTNIDADDLILATNKPVMPLDEASYSSYPLTTSELASLVASGTVRFFLLSLVAESRNGPDLATSWVQQHCATVPPGLYSAEGASAGTNGGIQLYDCVLLH